MDGSSQTGGPGDDPRLPADLERVLRILADLNGRSLIDELRQAVDAHVESEAAARRRAEDMTDDDLRALLGEMFGDAYFDAFRDVIRGGFDEANDE